MQTFRASALRLLIANALVLALALYWRWNPLEIILVFWVQAAIIGATQRLKIRDRVNHALRSGTRRPHLLYAPIVRPGIHNVFAAFYGVVWLVLGGIVLVKLVILPGTGVPLMPMLAGGSLFLAVHWWSYRSNKQTDLQQPIHLNNAFTLPIVRLLPLYVVAIAIAAEHAYASSTIVVWMVAKTLVDVGIHIHEHQTAMAA